MYVSLCSLSRTVNSISSQWVCSSVQSRELPDVTFLFAVITVGIALTGRHLRGSCDLWLRPQCSLVVSEKKGDLQVAREDPNGVQPPSSCSNARLEKQAYHVAPLLRPVLQIADPVWYAAQVHRLYRQSRGSL